MTEPLRIAFIGQKGIPAHWGGIEVHVDELATRLARRGHDVTVFVRSWYTPRQQQRYRGVRLCHLPTLRTKHLDATVHSLLASMASLRRRFDVVHYHAVGPALFAGLGRLGRHAQVTTIHGKDYLDRKWGGMAQRMLRLGERSAFAFCQQVIVVSQTLRAEYRKQGFEACYIPNGVTPQSPLPPHRITEKWGLEGDDYLLAMARWVPKKRLECLVEAFVSLDPPLDWRLVVAGDTSALPAYRQAIRDAAGGSERVVFPGYVRDAEKTELLANAAGFVTASEYEGLPIALLEAMSFGRPVLVTPIPPHVEVVSANDLGLVFEGNSVPAMAEGLRRFSSLPVAARHALGRAGQAHVRRVYDWEQVVDAHEALYRQLASPLAGAMRGRAPLFT